MILDFNIVHTLSLLENLEQFMNNSNFNIHFFKVRSYIKLLCIKSILLIFLTLLYLGYFSSNLYGIRVENQFNTDIWDNVFLLALIGFIFIYALFSLLVILFNLPTSSVFEQKMEEVMNFQKLVLKLQTVLTLYSICTLWLGQERKSLI